MSFADELRKKSDNYDFNYEQKEQINRIVHEKVNDCICGIKDLCLIEAKKGKTGISGYLSIEYEEYDTKHTAKISECSFEPFKTKDGKWNYMRPYSFDYGIDKPVFETSDEDRLKIALLIKDGILNGLRDCGFLHLSADIVAKPYYSKGTFLGKFKYSKTNIALHCIYISISWK